MGIWGLSIFWLFSISLPTFLPSGNWDIFCGFCRVTQHGSRMHCVLGCENTHFILLIHWFHTCEFPYLLKFICNAEINTYGAVAVFMDTHRSTNSTHPMCMFPVDVEQGNALLSWFNFHIANKGPFCGPVSANIFAFFLCFLLVISLLNLDPKPDAEVV